MNGYPGSAGVSPALCGPEARAEVWTFCGRTGGGSSASRSGCGSYAVQAGGPRSQVCQNLPGIPPSETVVAVALRHSLPEFLANAHTKHILEKFLRKSIDLDTADGLGLAAPNNSSLS